MIECDKCGQREFEHEWLNSHAQTCGEFHSVSEKVRQKYKMVINKMTQDPMWVSFFNDTYVEYIPPEERPPPTVVEDKQESEVEAKHPEPDPSATYSPPYSWEWTRALTFKEQNTQQKTSDVNSTLSAESRSMARFIVCYLCGANIER